MNGCNLECPGMPAKLHFSVKLRLLLVRVYIEFEWKLDSGNETAYSIKVACPRLLVIRVGHSAEVVKAFR